jgi:galactonate dehydratase
MKLDSVTVFVVGNPPPSFGGRYFVFLKLKTACGIEGVGEVYAATFGPKVIAAMIEDLFARRFVGRDPFQIESLWRESYGSGFSLRPDLSLMGVISGLEMACWDIIGKAVEQPIYNLLGGKVHERLRSYTYLYPGDGEGDDFYHDADRSASRAAEYVAQGFTGLKFDPTGGFSAYDPRQPTQESLERTVRMVSSPPPALFVWPNNSSPMTHCGSRNPCHRRCRNRWPSSRVAPAFPLRPASGSPPSMNLRGFWPAAPPTSFR